MLLRWPFLFIWPIWAPTLVWLAYGTVRPAVSRHAPEWRQQAPRGLWAVLAAPLLVGLWAMLGTGLGERPNDTPWLPAPAWPLNLLHVLGTLQFVLAVGALYRYRHAWPYAVPAVLAGLAYTVVAWFMGMMSITNTWL